MVAARKFSNDDLNGLRALVSKEREVTIAAVARFLACTRRSAEEAIRAIGLEVAHGSHKTYAPKPIAESRSPIPWPVEKLVLHPDLVQYVPRMPASDQLALEERLKRDGISQPLEINLMGQVLWGREEFEFAVKKSLPEVNVLLSTDPVGSSEEFEKIVLAHRPRSLADTHEMTLQAYRLKGLVAAKAAEAKKKTQFGANGNGAGHASGTDEETGETVERCARIVGLPIGYARTLRRSFKVLDFEAQHAKSVGTLFRGRLLRPAIALDGIGIPLDTQALIFEETFADQALDQRSRARLAERLVKQHTKAGEDSEKATPRRIMSEFKRLARPAAFLARVRPERLDEAVDNLGADEFDDLVSDLTIAAGELRAARVRKRGLKVVGAGKPLEGSVSNFNVAAQVRKVKSVKKAPKKLESKPPFTILEKVALASSDNHADYG